MKQESDMFISLQEATKFCNHSQEYLGLRARQGKLKAVKFGRNWVTKKEWLEEYITQVEEYNKVSGYISLQETTKYCPYSQAYLSLRARQGKLRAVKFGRNWVTKKEWLEEYLATIEEYKNNLQIKETKEFKKPKEKKEVLPPENLPIGEFEFIPVFQPLSIRRFPAFRLGFVTALVLILIIVGGIFGKTFSKNLSGSISLFVSSIRAEEILKDTREIFEEYGQWIGNKIFAAAKKLKEIPEKIVRGIKSIAQLWKIPEKIVEELIIPKPGEKEGMVVIPSTEEDELMKEKIKIAFSDEVKVEPEDKTSGIITPIFRTGEGDRYLYILVPLAEKK